MALTDELEKIVAAAGPPAVRCGDVLLYKGDALDILTRIPPSSIALTVTSPPYNIGKEYERKLPLADYLGWSKRWIDLVWRATAENGSFWLNLGYVPIPGRGKAVPLTYLLWPHLPFFLVQEVVWNYAAGVASTKMFSPRNEKWLWLVRDPNDYTFNLDAVRDPDVKYPNQKKNGKLRVNQSGKNPTDVWQIPKVTTGQGMTGQRASPERTAHPAQFPEAVIRRIILACSNPGDVILDPFGGSGTTASVALESGRGCVSIELLPEYVDISLKRLKNQIERSGQLALMPDRS